VTAGPSRNREPQPRLAEFQAAEGDRVRCGLCPHSCLVKEGGTGICKVRTVEGGKLVCLAYGRVLSLALDPIEKKPLFHFLPGSVTLSYCTPGCNLSCVFCQNHSSSQADEGALERCHAYVTPEELVQEGRAHRCRLVAHTYTEPTVYFEYAFDVAGAAVAAGMRNLFVTNGFMSAEALDRIAPRLHAANVDLKAFRDSTYRKACGGRLEPVLDTIRKMHALGIWVEVTTLVVPGLNDSPEELADIARFLVSVSPDIPWHVSRFHPDYKMWDRGPTPAATIEAACKLGLEAGLRFVYAGNLPDNRWEDTVCPACAALLIRRRGFSVLDCRLSHGRCPECSAAIPGVFD
jgi:pyruvate formate lyase activating enzyme